MRFLRTILPLLFALCSLSAAAQELTVISLTSNANDGIVLTFSQDVKVSHSIFGTKCYDVFEDNDANVKSLNATPIVQGTIVTLTAAWCTFVNGHSIHLELNPESFTTLDGATRLTGETVFDFVMGDGADAEAITALLVAPSNGTVTMLGNIAVVFAPTITEIVDPEGFTVTNENGSTLRILNVTIDGETSIKSLNVNVDTEATTLEGGTTYSLHIAPGAMNCGGITNDKELVYGKWYVKPQPLVLVTTPPHQRLVESISQITVKAENGRMLACTDLNCKDLRITGIMEDQTIEFAKVEHIASDRIGSTFTLTLDKPVNAEALAEKGAMYDFVKLAFPAGLFNQGSSINDASQTVWKIGTPKPLGDFTWNITPRPGTTLESLGTPLTVETENGENYDVYTLRFSITGQDAYMTINDAQNIKIVDAVTGETVKAFSRNNLRQENTNAFMLVMDHPITQNGQYTLVIPAASVAYYSDAEHYSAPQRPTDDIIATWTVYNANAPYYGDANGDGTITVSDITTSIEALNNPEDHTANLRNIDFDDDGSITPADIQHIVDILLRRH